LLLAGGAPIAMGGMLGRLGLQVRGEIFDDARSRASGASAFAAAGGVVRELMFDVAVDAFWLGPGMAFVSGLGPRLFAPLRGRVFVEGGRAMGRRVGRGFMSDGGGEYEEVESNESGIAAAERGGLLFGGSAGAESPNEAGIE
jgi:hypothetical protein